jgi:hypothetical protein
MKREQIVLNGNMDAWNDQICPFPVTIEFLKYITQSMIIIIMLINMISYIYNEIAMDTDGQVKTFLLTPTPTLCPSYIDLAIKNAIKI